MATIYTTGTWHVSPEKREAFIAAWADFAAYASSRPGSGGLMLTRDTKDEERFVSMGAWESADDSQAWKSTPEFSEQLARVLQDVDEFENTELSVLVTAEAGSSSTAAPVTV
jgi:heme-degrading monooxygenase HmoA